MTADEYVNAVQKSNEASSCVLGHAFRGIYKALGQGNTVEGVKDLATGILYDFDFPTSSDQGLTQPGITATDSINFCSIIPGIIGKACNSPMAKNLAESLDKSTISSNGYSATLNQPPARPASTVLQSTCPDGSEMDATGKCAISSQLATGPNDNTPSQSFAPTSPSTCTSSNSQVESNGNCLSVPSPVTQIPLTIDCYDGSLPDETGIV